MTNRKAVLVTGCSGGIGQAISQVVQGHGEIVIGLDKYTAENFVDHYYQVDLGDKEQLRHTLALIEKEHGEQLYALVNNAGLYEALDFLNLTYDDYEKIMGVNIRAPLFIAQWFSKIVLKSDSKGVIVNIASISGEHGSKDVVYGASKGAMINLTKSLSLSLSPQIRVNCVSPGLIATNMALNIPVERVEEYQKRILKQCFGKPKDVANAVGFLLDADNDYFNGSILNVDGGFQ